MRLILALLLGLLGAVVASDYWNPSRAIMGFDVASNRVLNIDTTSNKIAFPSSGTLTSPTFGDMSYADNYILVYEAGSGKIKKIFASDMRTTGAVSSFNGLTGALEVQE